MANNDQHSTILGAVWKLNVYLKANQKPSASVIREMAEGIPDKSACFQAMADSLKGFPKSLTHAYLKLIVWQLQLEIYREKVKTH